MKAMISLMVEPQKPPATILQYPVCSMVSLLHYGRLGARSRIPKGKNHGGPAWIH